MIKLLKRFALGLLWASPLCLASADTQITPGVGTTIFNFDCQANKQCPATVPIDATGVEKGTTTNPIAINPTGGTIQPVSGTVGVTGTLTSTQGNGVNTSPWFTTIRQGGFDAQVLPTGRLAVDIGSTALAGTVTANQGGSNPAGWVMQPGNTANTVPWLFTLKQGANTALVDGTGGLKVTVGNASIPISGSVGITGTLPPISLAAAATGGCTGGFFLSQATTNATAVKTGVGTLCELTAINTTPNSADLRLYNVAGTPNCASATGLMANYPIQGNTIGPGFVINLGPFGKAFTQGLGICLTGANANNDATPSVTGININYSFK